MVAWWQNKMTLSDYIPNSQVEHFIDVLKHYPTPM